MTSRTIVPWLYETHVTHKFGTNKDGKLQVRLNFSKVFTRHKVEGHTGDTRIKVLIGNLTKKRVKY